MIFKSDKLRSSGIADRRDPFGQNFQIFALSLSDLNRAAERVSHDWFRRERGRLRAGRLSETDWKFTEADEDLLNRPIESLHSEKMNPLDFQVSWTNPSSLNHRTRSVPRILVHESKEAQLVNLEPEIPTVKHSYCVVAGLVCRESYFLNVWEKEGRVKDLAWQAHRAELDKYELDYQNWLQDQRLAEPERPQPPRNVERETHSETIASYFLSQQRRWLVALLLANEWVDNPLSDPALTPQQAQAYSTLNARFSQIDLGRNSYLSFSSNPGPRRKYCKGPTP